MKTLESPFQSICNIANVSFLKQYRYDIRSSAMSFRIFQSARHRSLGGSTSLTYSTIRSSDPITAKVQSSKSPRSEKNLDDIVLSNDWGPIPSRRDPQPPRRSDNPVIRSFEQKIQSGQLDDCMTQLKQKAHPFTRTQTLKCLRLLIDAPRYDFSRSRVSNLCALVLEDPQSLPLPTIHRLLAQARRFQCLDEMVELYRVKVMTFGMFSIREFVDQLKLLTRENRPDLCREVLVIRESSNLQSQWDPLEVHAVTRFATKVRDQELLEQMERILRQQDDQMMKNNAFVCESFLLAHCALGNLERVTELYQERLEMKKQKKCSKTMVRTNSVFTAMFKCLLQAREFDRAHAVFQDMVMTFDIRPHVHHYTIFEKHVEPKVILELFGQEVIAPFQAQLIERSRVSQLAHRTTAESHSLKLHQVDVRYLTPGMVSQIVQSSLEMMNDPRRHDDLDELELTLGSREGVPYTKVVAFLDQAKIPYVVHPGYLIRIDQRDIHEVCVL